MINGNLFFNGILLSSLNGVIKATNIKCQCWHVSQKGKAEWSVAPFMYISCTYNIVERASQVSMCIPGVWKGRRICPCVKTMALSLTWVRECVWNISCLLYLKHLFPEFWVIGIIVLKYFPATNIVVLCLVSCFCRCKRNHHPITN